MRRTLVLPFLVAATVVAAGCISVKGEDPFAYMKKPLFASAFQLASVGDGSSNQSFHVTDGSIVHMRAMVWVNATMGDARVEILDPSGNVALSTTQDAEQLFPLELGRWTVRVTGTPDAEGQIAGDVGVHVVRAA